MTSKTTSVNKNTPTPASSSEEKPRVRCTKICRKCGKIGHIEKYCLTTQGGCVFIGDLPPSYTEEEIRTLVEKESGVKIVHLKSGTDKFSSRWALVNLEKKEDGEKLIKDLDEFEVKGRDIFVKWRDDGVWICPDPTCQMRNFLDNDNCFKCRFPKKKVEKVNLLLAGS